ncbi:hypothetical protein IVB34_12875 [Bradyrhizobium sp. 2]|uniref:hypothetical protein n=1 Tax=Bradyrhizobium sp. 2 TaxID=190045 RepID=UPI001FF80CCA|nr:hypothetical protein [Bradyrhizobium sp. 2]MCK1459249.1 hypothetical protein [Bradyrhizobium sp. 2]
MRDEAIIPADLSSTSTTAKNRLALTARTRAVINQINVLPMIPLVQGSHNVSPTPVSGAIGRKGVIVAWKALGTARLLGGPHE